LSPSASDRLWLPVVLGFSSPLAPDRSRHLIGLGF
jgi:hypothetical protein